MLTNDILYDKLSFVAYECSKIKFLISLLDFIEKNRIKLLTMVKTYDIINFAVNGKRSDKRTKNLQKK